MGRPLGYGTRGISSPCFWTICRGGWPSWWRTCSHNGGTLYRLHRTIGLIYGGAGRTCTLHAKFLTPLLRRRKQCACDGCVLGGGGPPLPWVRLAFEEVVGRNAGRSASSPRPVLSHGTLLACGVSIALLDSPMFVSMMRLFVAWPCRSCAEDAQRS